MSASVFKTWFARPIAHRGLHDEAKGVVENSIASAQAAIVAGYAIECDVQLTSDKQVVVFHDDALERLTATTGDVRAKTAAELAQIPLRGGREPAPMFGAFLAAIGGRTPLVVEIKSIFDGDLLLARRVAEIVARYDGPLVIESFDPDPIAYLREHSAELGVGLVPLGMVGMARYDEADWPGLSAARREELTQFQHYPRTRPDFLSWNLGDLPHAVPLLCRQGLKMPVSVWTVRSQEQAKKALRYADQIVFEGFRA
jgi:glycerophosphoryl diester phosphodiesterase